MYQTKNTKEEQWNDLILNSPLISNFIFDQLDLNRKAFSLLKEGELLKNLTPALIPSYEEFYEYCKTKGVNSKMEKKRHLRL